MELILTFLMLFQIHAVQPTKPSVGMPKDFYLSRGIVNPKYEVVRFGDTVILPDNWCSWITDCDVRLKLRWDRDFPVVEIRRMLVPYKDWKGQVLPITPGCYGEQRQVEMPQKPFYFDDRSPEGMTIRGKAGMRIWFWCQTVALKAVP